MLGRSIPKAIAEPLALLTIIFALVVPITIWAQSYGWRLSGLTNAELFPLFGLLAFSLMWLQVVFVHIFVNIGATFHRWFSVSAGLGIFVFIILHPLLLATAQFEATEKLPPESWYKVVSGKYRDYITIGIIAWLTFLAYDVARLVKKASWYPRYSWIIRYTGHAAFLLIFIHGLGLGTHLQGGFARVIWVFFGASALILMLWEARRDIANLR